MHACVCYVNVAKKVVNAYVEYEEVRVQVESAGLDGSIVAVPTHRLVGGRWFSRMIPFVLNMRMQFRMVCPRWMTTGVDVRVVGSICPVSTICLKSLRSRWWWFGVIWETKCRIRRLWVVVITTRILVVRG